MLDRSGERVRAVLNILLESPYFCAYDDRDLFFFLRRHRREFADSFTAYYGWSLLIDAKCARVYKPEWYNTAITPTSRTMFNFTKRDECLAFMMLLEFYEHQLEENGMTADDKEKTCDSASVTCWPTSAAVLVSAFRKKQKDTPKTL